ncbi:MAG: hypothetical protein ACOH5I_13770 [Oligoflexus sp.]
MKKCKKIKSTQKSLGVALLYTLAGTGCGIQEPPPSFGEKSRASIHLTIENDLGEDFIASNDAIWQDDHTDEELIDQILNEYEAENSTDSDDSTSQAENEDEPSDDLLPAYTEPLPEITSDDDFAVSPKERTACAQLHGVDSERVTVAGNKNQATIRGSSIVAARVTGNQNELDLHLASYSPSTLKGICIFASGNQSSITVFVENIMLESVYLIVRGNDSKIHMSFNESYTQMAIIDLGGNQSLASLKGLPEPACSQAVVRYRGQNPQFQCL